MTKPITVVIPHSITVKWLQIVVASMKEYKNDTPFDILVVDNTPAGFPSGLEALTETSLGEGVRIEDNKYYRSHSCALDYGLALIETPFLFAAETDCQALKDHWLDRFLAQMKDEWVAMAGWYWGGSDREYIHCGGCLYSTKIMNRFKRQIQENDNYMICYGTDLKKRMDLSKHHDFEKWIKSPFHGPFSETRGFQEIWSFADYKWYQEPGAYPYYRSKIEYECVEMPGTLIYLKDPHVADGTWLHDNPGEPTPKDNAYWVHHWAGTVSHNWQWMKVTQKWQRNAYPYWIDREDRIWREVVPASARNWVLQNLDVKTGDEEKEFILGHPNFGGIKEEEITD